MRGRWAVLLMAGTLAACSLPSDMSLLEGSREAQRPKRALLSPPSPVLAIARNPWLVAIAASDLKSIFGEPALVRDEGGVQYWRYSFAGCTLDLFVNTQEGGDAEVIYFELQSHGVDGNHVAEAECARLGEHLKNFEPDQ